jgi:hypothetical protein
LAPEQFPDPHFAVCRLMYTSVRREPAGGGWRTDYPYGEINLSIRFSELTRTRVSWMANHQPNHYVVRLTDDALFQCPFTIASDVGTIGLRQQEAERLRLYLLKGGFLWVDDFWGTLAWEQWEHEFNKVLPTNEYPIEDVPISDPIFQSQFIVTKVPQITNIGFWRRSGGRETSERGDDSRVPHFRAVRDGNRRIMVVMTHNTDIADSWEREGEESRLLLPVLTQRVRRRDQRAAARDDALTVTPSQPAAAAGVQSRRVVFIDLARALATCVHVVRPYGRGAPRSAISDRHLVRHLDLFSAGSRRRCSCCSPALPSASRRASTGRRTVDSRPAFFKRTRRFALFVVLGYALHFPRGAVRRSRDRG